MTRLDDIEQRLARLEQRSDQKPAPRFAGIWRDGQAYNVGDFVIRAGSTWACVAPAAPGVMPGLQDDAAEDGPWRLAAMRGRPGKDANTGDLERRVRALEQRR